MPHIILAIATIGIVRFAWLNFRELGRLRKQIESQGTDAANAYNAEQMKYVMRLVLCLVLLAIAPFAFTMITK